MSSSSSWLLLNYYHDHKRNERWSCPVSTVTEGRHKLLCLPSDCSQPPGRFLHITGLCQCTVTHFTILSTPLDNGKLPSAQRTQQSGGKHSSYLRIQSENRFTSLPDSRQSVSQGRICLGLCMCCYTAIKAADQTSCLNQSHQPDNRPTSSSIKLAMPSVWQACHQNAKLLSHSFYMAWDRIRAFNTRDQSPNTWPSQRCGPKLQRQATESQQTPWQPLLWWCSTLIKTESQSRKM